MKTLLTYLSMGLACLIFFGFITKIWEGNLKIPFSYDGDTLYYSALIKTYVDNGSFFGNKFLGAPGTLNWRDYPETLDNLNLFLIRVITLFSKQWPVVLNLFYILTYPLVGISALYALRQMKLRTPTAFVGSLLFTFLPYHFARGESHLFLSAYYAVPLAILLCYRIHKGENWKSWLNFVSCLVLGSTGPYYAFFGGFFIFLTGIYTSLEKRRWRDLLIACLFTLLVLAVAVIHLTPNIVYSNRNGWNNFFIKRSLGETEIYGLKIAQLLLPINFHRLRSLADLRYFYNKGSFLINENTASSLGIVGSVGFILLIALRIFNFPTVIGKSTANQLKLWGSLVVGGVYLGVVGGGGSILSLFGFSQIRSYNRISVYLAFLAILSVCLIIDHFFRDRSNRDRRLYYSAVVAVLVIGLLDQTPGYLPRYERVAKKFETDALYFDKINQTVKSGKPVFQLPYVSFPENPLVNDMESYENVKPYLHSNGISWSYGAMTDRYFDLWQREISNLPAPKLLEVVKKAGFGGILINKAGYTDGGTALEKELSEILRIQPLRDEPSRFSFFSILGGRKEEAKPNFSVLTRWIDGCYQVETSVSSRWQWCKKIATLVVINPDKENHRVRFEMDLASGSVRSSRLWVSGLINSSMEVDSVGSRIVEEVVVSPGHHLITFTSEAVPLDSAKDKRWLVFRVTDYKATDLDALNSH